MEIASLQQFLQEEHDRLTLLRSELLARTQEKSFLLESEQMRFLMRLQLQVMTSYRFILHERIKLLKK